MYDADDTPKALIDWVVQGYDQQLRVSLGPNGSFFAWTSDRIRWQNLPPGLEKAIQGWLGPTGWTSGPPRLVSLGPDGSYFALSEYGACAWSFPDALIAKHPCFKTLDDEIEKERPNLEIFEVSSCAERDNRSWLTFKAGDEPEHRSTGPSYLYQEEPLVHGFLRRMGTF